MTFATSSGVSMRPSGTLLRRALVNSAGLTNGHDRVTPTEAPSKERSSHLIRGNAGYLGSRHATSR